MLIEFLNHDLCCSKTKVESGFNLRKFENNFLLNKTTTTLNKTYRIFLTVLLIQVISVVTEIFLGISSIAL